MQVCVMFIIINLMELCMGNMLMLTYLIGNSFLGFHNGVLDSYLFKLTLGIDCLECFPGQLLLKASCPSNITKIPVIFKPEL